VRGARYTFVGGVLVVLFPSFLFVPFVFPHEPSNQRKTISKEHKPDPLPVSYLHTASSTGIFEGFHFATIFLSIRFLHGNDEVLQNGSSTADAFLPNHHGSRLFKL